MFPLLRVPFLPGCVEASSTSGLTNSHKTGPFVRGGGHLNNSIGINLMIGEEEPKGVADVSCRGKKQVSEEVEKELQKPEKEQQLEE